jgi:cytochrome c peroxidase
MKIGSVALFWVLCSSCAPVEGGGDSGPADGGDQLDAGEGDAGVAFAATPFTYDLPEYWEAVNLLLLEPGDNPTTEEGVALGRRLFYEKRLSLDDTLACAGCHLQEKGFADPNRFSKGVRDQLGDRQAMALGNATWSFLMFWDGRAKGLEDQARGPVPNPVEMDQSWDAAVAKLQADRDYPNLFSAAFGTAVISEDLVVKAIAQFERTMISFRSPWDRYVYAGEEDAVSESVKRGFALFESNRTLCARCHGGRLFTNSEFHNNGLEAEPEDLGRGGVTELPSHMGLQKTPTLRNIGVTAPYMHDGRFATLREVVDHYDHGIVTNSRNLTPFLFGFGARGMGLSEQEKADLIAFMEALTDEWLLTAPALSDPFSDGD